MSVEKEKNPMVDLLTNRNFWVAFIIQIIYTVGNVCVKQTVTLQASNLGMSAAIIGVIASFRSEKLYELPGCSFDSSLHVRKCSQLVYR